MSRMRVPDGVQTRLAQQLVERLREAAGIPASNSGGSKGAQERNNPYFPTGKPIEKTK